MCDVCERRTGPVNDSRSAGRCGRVLVKWFQGNSSNDVTTVTNCGARAALGEWSQLGRGSTPGRSVAQPASGGGGGPDLLTCPVATGEIVELGLLEALAAARRHHHARTRGQARAHAVRD